MIPYAKIYAAECASLCQDEERMVDVISIQYAPGLEVDGRESNRVSIDLLDGVHLPALERFTERAINGLTLDVGEGARARVLATCAASSPFLALTNKRLLIVENLQHDNREVTWVAALPDVRSLRWSPHPMLNVGRIRVAFRDGSMVRLRAGALVPIAAWRFVASFRRVTGR